jgi:autotransporter-associated beta strand protein
MPYKIHILITFLGVWTATIGLLSAQEAATPTLAINFMHPSFEGTTGLNEGENTAALDSEAGFNNPSWTNLGIGENGRGSIEASGISVQTYGSGRWVGGSESVTVDNDASQQVFRTYVDDFENANTYFNGDGIGASIHVSGIHQYLAATGQTRYNLTVFFGSDTTGTTFRTTTVSEGVPAAPAANSIPNLRVLGRIFPIQPLGNGRYPIPDIGHTANGARGWGQMLDLAADSLVIHTPSAGTGRGSIAGIAITPVSSLPEEFVHRVTDGMRTVNVNLRRWSIRSGNFGVLVQGSDGLLTLQTAAQNGPERTYLGTVEGHPDAMAAALLRDNGEVYCRVIFGNGEEINTTVIRPGTHGENPTMGIGRPNFYRAEERFWPTRLASPGGAGSNAHAIEAGVDSTYPHFLACGGTVDGVRDAAEFSMACMGAVYLRDTSIFYRTGKIVIRTDSLADPYQGNAGLADFRTQWTGAVSNQVGATHGIAVLVNGQGGGGVAWLATAATGFNQYSIVRCHERGDFTYFWLHEAAHNWAGGHWEGGGDYPDEVGNNGRQPEGNTILSSGNFARFSSADVSRIVAHRERNAGNLDLTGNFPLPIPPRANMDRAYHTPGQPVRIDVLENDSDVNGHALTLIAADPVSSRGGTAVISPGTGPQGRDEILYTPPPHDDAWTKSPDDLFIYQIQDSSGQTAQGFVVVRPDLTSEALVAHWTFDEPDGNDLLDASGMQRNGILFNNPARTEGHSGQALELNGANQYANFPAIDLLTNRLTVTGWVRRNGAQLDGATLFGTEWSSLRLNLNTSHELRATWSGHNSQRNINSSLVLPDGVWSFVALVISPERGAVHLRPSGQAGQWFEVTTGNFVPVQLSERFFIGSRTDGSNRFGGAIDDFRVFGRSLSNAEVESLAAGNGTPVASQPGSIGHFPADQSAELSWIPAAGTTSHRLYLADDLDTLRNAVPGSPADRGLVESPHNPGVLATGFHYWRVDSTRDGVTVQGPVWMLRVGNRTPQFTQTVIHLPSVVQGEPLAGTLADYASDSDGDVLTFQRITPSNWLTIAPDGALSGTAGPLQVGMHGFVVRITDPSGAYSEATFKFRVRGLANTVAFNFAQSGSTNSTGVNAAETTATLNASAGLENPSWTNLTMPGGGVNLNGVHGGISYTIHGSNRWQSGSDSLSGSDASQQVFRSYLDHGDTGGSLVAGDGIGASIQLSGLADFLTANQADRYTLTLFLTTDWSNSFFRGAEIREGAPQGAGIHRLLDLPVLGSILRDDLTLGDGRFPLPEAGGDAGGTRGWGEFAGLTADSITITLPAFVDYPRTGRNSIAGFAITPIPANVPPAFKSEFIDETGALEGISYSTNLAIHASDSNPGDPLRYQILSGPAWLSMDEITGIASGIPGPSDGGENVWTVQVTDLAGASGIATLRIAVTPDSGERTWDISASPGIQNGAGIWDHSNTNWTRFNGDTNQSWVNGLSAIFAGNLVPSQTHVTLSGELSANNLSRSGSNAIRLIASAGNTLAIDGTVDVATGSYLIFASSGASQFSGSFTKIGGGFLELNGNNAGHHYGSVTLDEGTIGFWDGSGLQSEAVTLNGGSIGSLNNTGRFFDGNIMIGGDVGIGAVPGTGLSTGMMTFSSTGTIDLGGAMRTLTIGSTVNFNGVVTNGGIIKAGAGTLTLGNSNNYAGYTTVEAGTLSLAQPFLADASAIHITSGAVLNLSHGALDDVGHLIVDGVLQADGIYHSANTTFITGTGSLRVGGSTFDSWLVSFGLVPGTPRTGPDESYDDSGVPNILQFALGGDPKDPSRNSVQEWFLKDAANHGELVLTVAVRSGASFAGNPSPTANIEGISYGIQGSLTLGTWDEVVAETALVNGGGTIEVPLGYELKSFRLVHESGLASQGFLRVAVHQSTP